MSKAVSNYGNKLARENVLFHSMDEELFNRLIKGAYQISLTKGEALFAQGDNANNYYLIINGRIKAFHLSIDGREKVVEVFTKGDTFGEAVMIMDKGKHPVYAAALELTEVVVFNSRDYSSVLKDSSESCLLLMSHMAHRLDSHLKDMETLTVQNARHRVIRYLLTQLELSNNNVVVLPMTKRLVASRLAMQPETLSRIINALKKQGILDIKGLDLHICDATALKGVIAR